MAKLSARGATVLSMYRAAEGDRRYAIRSDGAVLSKYQHGDGSWTGWSILFKIAGNPTAAEARLLRLKPTVERVTA